ncbi:MAG: extracellular solute-binding protein [Chloroflexi bacterium]|nr:extracellular solute-binding protein [Chloroflexota bacterium]MCL5109124.1 extracellular solute-binding protein [Chloroflexota bacterium]
MSDQMSKDPSGKRIVTRRAFLGAVTALGAAAIAAGCQTPAAAPTTAPKPAATTAPAATQAPKPAATTAPAPSAAAAATQAPTQAGAAKKLAGVSLNGALFQHPYSDQIKALTPEFEALTGAKVNIDVNVFANYNQKMDLELSTKGSAYDFANITFIYTSKWIGAGWFTDLEPYIADPNKTPKEWNADDFAPAAMQALRGKDGHRFAMPHECGGQLMAAARGDLVEKAGLQMPKTFDEMIKVFDAVQDKDGVKAFVEDNLHHWESIGYIQGYGGSILKNPPDNLTPVLDTPEVAQGAGFYANLLKKYCPDGVLSYTDTQAMEAQLQGRANFRTQSLAWLSPIADPAKSKCATTVKYAVFPSGPKGAFPQINSHGAGIPIGSKNKDAAWEWIKWAYSPEMIKRLSIELKYSTICRLSVVNTPEYKKMMTLNGQDVASLYANLLGQKPAYMAYRTVVPFPQIGAAINKAVSAIATGQATPEAAMKTANQEAAADIKKAGFKIDI